MRRSAIWRQLDNYTPFAGYRSKTHLVLGTTLASIRLSPTWGWGPWLNGVVGISITKRPTHRVAEVAGLIDLVRLTKSRFKKFYKRGQWLGVDFSQVYSLKEVIDFFLCFCRACICIVMLFKIKGLAFRQETLGGANRRLKGEELIFLPPTPLVLLTYCHLLCFVHKMSEIGYFCRKQLCGSAPMSIKSVWRKRVPRQT